MVIVSPHLDDAVFSCGQSMACHANCTVVTVFAGVPEAGLPAPEWDEQCGFHSGREAVLARRQEDRNALAVLNARPPVWLDFLDSQYRRPVSLEELSDALSGALLALNPDLVLVPLGLFHSDHLLTHDAALHAIHRKNSLSQAWTLGFYEDVPYRGRVERVQRRIHALRDQGFALRHATLSRAHLRHTKMRAARCYVSQLQALGPSLETQLGMPEVTWRVPLTMPIALDPPAPLRETR